MIGRVEIEEILGMVATISLLLAIGFAVDSLENRAQQAFAKASPIRVEAPDLSGVDRGGIVQAPPGVRLEAPVLRPPAVLPVPAVGRDPRASVATAICTCGEEVAGLGPVSFHIHAGERISGTRIKVVDVRAAGVASTG